MILSLKRSTTMWFARRFLSSVARSQYGGQCSLFHRPQHCSLPKSEPRYLQCTCCWRSRIPVAGFETLDTTLTSEPCKGDDSRPLDECYTPEQQQTILELLNTATLERLSDVKLLRGCKSVNIVEYRTKNGPFKTLESVVNVPRLKHKSAVTVFNSILNPVKKEEKKKVKIQQVKFITPVVDKSWLEDARSIVSIVCGTNKIAWACVDHEMTVLDWQQLDCPHFFNGPYTVSAYLNDVSKVVTLLPSADFYIIEKVSISVQNTTMFPIVAHMRTVEAMLFALLEPRNTPADSNIPPRVLNMTRASVGRHFGLMMGDSRSSGAQLVRQLMTESVTQEVPRINIPLELLMMYRNYFQMDSRREGESLSDALLQALAFYEILRKSAS